MNEDHPYIINIDEETENKKERFPVFAQLIVLGFIMTALFGSWVFQNVTPKPEAQATEAKIPTDVTKYPLVPQKIEEVTLRATAAYVWDVEGQRALYNKNADEQLPLASITKLMTTLLAHELTKDDRNISITQAGVLQEGSSGLLPGESFTSVQLRELALISSSNDAAYTLAASVGTLLGDNDPATQFVSGMNIRAEELGLATLKFWNTTGLDRSLTQPGSIGSARDVSFLMEYIVTNYPEIIAPTQNATARVYNSAGLYHDIKNTNPIATKVPNLIGSKTGYTDLAGGNLTIAFDVGLNRPIIITVLGSTYNERFEDVLTLVAAVQESINNQE